MSLGYDIEFDAWTEEYLSKSSFPLRSKGVLIKQTEQRKVFLSAGGPFPRPLVKGAWVGFRLQYLKG
jgi:hypothetical protein